MKSRVVVLRMDSNKEDIIDKFWSITLLSAELMISAKVLTKRSARVVGHVGKTQTFSIPSQPIHDNLHLIYRED